MIKTNINEDKVKFSNLHRSFFKELSTICKVTDTKVLIIESSGDNPDPASVHLEQINDQYYIYYWDGYSLADKFVSDSYDDALVKFKNYAKKMAKNLRRF